MNVVGIDIGTTTIGVLAVDAHSGKTVKSITVNSDSFITTENAYKKIQSVEIIVKRVFALLDEIMATCSPVCCIGVTGQMHGIVYIDGDGKACSPLATWQDGRANLKCADGTTYCEKIAELTGIKTSSGYGLATHYYNIQNGLVPENAETFCTIHDYIVMLLCGNKRPLMHTSDAASFGLYDLKTAQFNKEALKILGIDSDMLPDVTDKETAAGTYQGIPVSVAIGDNQASFIGSVSDSENTVLVNIGTGSQISVLGSIVTYFSPVETRPLTGGKHILVGSALCGGRVFACLENFFKTAFAEYAGKCESAYAFMDKLAEQNYPIENELIVDTSLSGTRSNPNVRGKIENICIDNFTPAHLVCGVLKGSVAELYGMYQEIRPSLVKKPTVLVGSGNGLRKSPVWRRITEEMFGMKMSVPLHKEEAAYGASIFALAACNVYKDIATAQKIIRYI